MSELNECVKDLRDRILRKCTVLVDLDGRMRKDIARAAGLYPAALSSILLGGRPFSLEMICRLALALRVTPERLFTEPTAEELTAWETSRRVSRNWKKRPQWACGREFKEVKHAGAVAKRRRRNPNRG